MLEYQPALAAAAIGATQWAPRLERSATRQASSRHKQATRDPDRTATTRSGRRSRNAAREPDAFSAYGAARR